MRIISQDGMIDFPYEHAVININYRNKNEIVANGINCDADTPFPIAKYSDENKAKKAMEILQRAYCGSLNNFIDEFVFRAKNYDSRPELLEMLNEAVKSVQYFRFPADNEIEV